MNFFKAFGFWFWLFEIVMGFIYLATNIPINPIVFILIAVCGLLEWLNRTIDN